MLFRIIDSLKFIESKSTFTKLTFLWIADACIVSFSILLVRMAHTSFYLSYSEFTDLLPIIFVSIASLSLYFHFGGLYNHLLRYLGASFFFEILKSVTFAQLTTGLLCFLVWPGVATIELIVFGWSLIVIGTFSTRRIAKWAKEATLLEHPKGIENIAIFGAGSAGVAILEALESKMKSNVVAFFDDDIRFSGKRINGVKIYHANSISDITAKFRIVKIIIAISAITQKQRRDILERVQNLGIRTQILPGLSELIEGKVALSQIRDVKVSDIMLRKQSTPDENLIQNDIKGKNVLVTGGGGSIGSELCRQSLKFGANRIVIFEHSEFNLYSIEQELLAMLASSGGSTSVVAVLGDINSLELIERVIKENHIHTIYHAAAYKHVPMVEANICLGVYNNSFGTRSVAQAAVNARVEKFVLISTDKAVRPTNVMGASKRLAEMILQAMNDKFSALSPTKFTMVRFGNVLDSAGSVVPLFRKQIAAGGPLTLTHKDVTRFFMTIPEAAQLVLQAGAMSSGGDVFILDMGEPVKIFDLAERMIRLSGNTVSSPNASSGDIEIKITGLRPGEKLYEELVIGKNITETSHPSIYRAEEDFVVMEELVKNLSILEAAISLNDSRKIKIELGKLVEGFNSK